MTGKTRYTIFQTRWGYFGLVCTGELLCRTLLPMPRRQDAVQLLQPPGEARFERGLLSVLQDRVMAYYEGQTVDFTVTPEISLADRSAFARAVLAQCRQIPFGQRRTYADLAASIAHPGAARAVGTVMAQNPIPLIIPCHRVLRTDGGLGGFSAFGGTATKQKMLAHEAGV